MRKEAKNPSLPDWMDKPLVINHDDGHEITFTAVSLNYDKISEYVLSLVDVANASA